MADFLPLKPNLLVKIDTQGFEDRVIRGGEQTIKKASIVVVEVSFTKLYEHQPLFSDLRSIAKPWFCLCWSASSAP